MTDNIAVVGSNSMVGSRFCELNNNFKLIKTDLKGDISVDITDNESVNVFFEKFSFSHLILFSAYTDVDGAESQRGKKNDAAWQINVNGSKNIAKACKEKNVKLIFISTEFVFSGVEGPYREDAQREKDENKISWYGLTKSKGEEIIESELSDPVIIRITYPYRSKFNEKDDFARSILKNYESGNLHPMFTDQKITPTFIDDVAYSIELLINKNEKGIFHVASPQRTTPYKFAEYLLNKFKKNAKELKESSIVDYLKDKTKGPRPVNGGLISEKITSLGFTPTNWDKGIDEIYRQING